MKKTNLSIVSVLNKDEIITSDDIDFINRNIGTGYWKLMESEVITENANRRKDTKHSENGNNPISER